MHLSTLMSRTAGRAVAMVLQGRPLSGQDTKMTRSAYGWRDHGPFLIEGLLTLPFGLCEPGNRNHKYYESRPGTDQCDPPQGSGSVSASPVVVVPRRGV